MLVLYTDRIGLTSDGMFSDSDRMEKNRILLRYTIFVHFTPFRLNPVQSEIYSSSFGSDRIGSERNPTDLSDPCTAILYVRYRVDKC